jgi:hypothetical protein
MIRRLFWLSLGAVLGVAGYRRVTALARAVRPAPSLGSMAGFAADVREGMALYLDRQAEREHERATSTLEAHPRRGLARGAGPGEPRAIRGDSPRKPPAA